MKNDKLVSATLERLDGGDISSDDSEEDEESGDD